MMSNNYRTGMFELRTAGYIKPDGEIITLGDVDGRLGYHGDVPEFSRQGWTEFSHTHNEDDTCIRIYDTPTPAQYDKIEMIIDEYLDEEGYCKVEIFDPNPHKYVIFTTDRDTCSLMNIDDYETVYEGAQWYGYTIVRWIKQNIHKQQLEESMNSNDMSEKLQRFIEENIDLIDQNTKESWEQIYTKINSFTLKGEFTAIMLSSDIDPAEILGYIPRDYLRESSIVTCRIPDGVTSIDYGAFFGCTHLTSIEIPNSVTSIGDAAFCACTSLTSVEIPSGVTSIGEYAFSQCSSLMSVEIPNSVTTIDYKAFYKCGNLTEVNFKGTRKEAIKCRIGNRSRTRWRENSAIEKIICNDGVIEL